MTALITSKLMKFLTTTDGQEDFTLFDPFRLHEYEDSSLDDEEAEHFITYALESELDGFGKGKLNNYELRVLKYLKKWRSTDPKNAKWRQHAIDDCKAAAKYCWEENEEL